MIKRESEKETPEDLKQAFRVFDKVRPKIYYLKISYTVLDKDGNGFVSTAEIKYVLTRIGLVFTDDELGEMVQEADIDGDQHVSFEEFRDIFNEG